MSDHGDVICQSLSLDYLTEQCGIPVSTVNRQYGLGCATCNYFLEGMPYLVKLSNYLSFNFRSLGFYIKKFFLYSYLDVKLTV